MIRSPMTDPVPRRLARMPWYALGAGALYGLVMRVLFTVPYFSRGGGAGGPMLVSFLFFVPFVIGALTVFLIPREQRRFGASLWRPLVPMSLFLVGSAVLLLEGSICIIMAAPIFLLMSSIGGAIAYLVLRVVEPSGGSVGGVLLLPLLTGAFEAGHTLPDFHGLSEASIHIDAPAAAVWRSITDAQGIRPDELSTALAYHIGVPYPLQATTTNDAAGNRVREVRWDRGVHFDEPIEAWEENRHIRWTYRFSADSIPPGALDEHVSIGGRYFDLLDTDYRLESEGQGTRLTMRFTYRISTPFNFYATRVGGYLVNDASVAILKFYKNRSEHASAE